MEPVYTLVRRSARLYQRISAFVILALASMGLLYFLLYFTINSGFANQIFDATFNEQIKGKLTWSRVSWGPLPWKVKILEPAILDPAGNPVVRAKSLTVDELDLIGLVQGKIRIDGVNLDTPVIRITSRLDREALDEFGKPTSVTNIAEAFQSKRPSSSDGTNSQIDLEINEIQLTNGTFTLNFEQLSITAKNIDAVDTEFRLYTARSTDVMGFEIQDFGVREGEVRVSKPVSVGRPLNASSSEYYSFPLSDLKTNRIKWNGDRFRLDGTTFKLRGDSVLMPRLQMDLDRVDLPHLKTELEFTTYGIQNHLADLGVDTVTGFVSAKVNGEGELDAFKATALLTGRKLTVAGIRIEEVSTEIQHTERGQAKINFLNAQFDRGRLSAHGIFDIETGFVRANLFPKGITLSALNVTLPQNVKQFAETDVTGNARIVITNLLGEIPTYRLQTHLRLSHEDVHPYGLDRDFEVTTDATYSDEIVHIDDFKLSDGKTRVSMEGEFDIDTYVMTLKGRLSTRDLRPITRAFGDNIAGQVNLDFSAAGPAILPRIRANVKARNVRRGDLPTLNATGRATYLGGRLDLDGWTIQSDKGDVSIQGWMHLLKTGIPWDLRINARKFEIGTLPLGIPVSGRAGVDVRIQGSVDEPKIAGRGRIGRPCYTTPYGKVPLCFRRMDVVGEWLGDRFTLEQFRVRDNRRTLLDVSGRGQVKARQFDGRLKTERLPTRLTNFFVADPVPIRGDVSADLTLEGTLTNPVGTGRITLHEGGYAEYELGDTTFEIEAKDGAVRLNGSIFDKIQIRAHIPVVDENTPATGELDFDGLSLESHLPQLSELPLKTFISGRLTLEALPFKGTLKRASITMTQLQAAYDLDEKIGYAVDLRHPAKVDWAGDRVTLNRLNLRLMRRESGQTAPSDGDDSFIIVQGTSDLSGRLDLVTRGRLSFGLVTPYLNSVFTRSEGALTLKGTLSGPANRLIPNLELVLESAELSPRTGLIGSRLKLMEPVRLVIQPLRDDEQTTASETGTFELSLANLIDDDGNQVPMRINRDDTILSSDELYLKFLGFKPDLIRISASGSELELNLPRVMKGSFNAPRVTFEMWEHRRENRRPETRMKLSGEIDVIEGEYVADLTSSADINQDVRNRLSGRARRHTVSIFERIPSLKRLMLDLKVGGNGGFYVRNQVLTLTNDLEIKLDLEKIQGFLIKQSGDLEEEDLKIEGTVEVLPDSKITYARREFDVTSGILNFGGRNFFAAQLEATRTFALRTDGESSTVSSSFDTGAADVRLEEVVLSAGLTIPYRGADPELKFDLSSNSGASKLDVAWLVLTGSYPDNLSGSASAQPAAEVVLAPLLSLVERPLEETFKVDLTLTPVSSGTLYIDANKFLSRRLRLYSRVFVGDEDDGNPQQFGLQYQINNVAFGELSSAQSGSSVSTTGKLKLRLSLK